MANEVRSITLETVQIASITSDGHQTLFGTEQSYGFGSSEYGVDGIAYGYASYEYIEGKAGIE